MSSSHTFLKYTRLTHLYIGVFITPALLFFAFTGALQTFSLHETTRGSSYKPPAWAVLLAQIHKKQTPVVPVRKLSRRQKRPQTRPSRRKLLRTSHKHRQQRPHRNLPPNPTYPRPSPTTPCR